MDEVARRSGAHRQRVDERVLARRKEEHGCVVHTGIDNQSDERTVVDEQSTGASDQPSVVKDEDVSLDRCPGENERGRVVETEIDEPPDQAASGCRWLNGAQPDEVEVPGNVGELDDESDEEEENDGVVVKSYARRSIGEKVDEDEE